MSGHNTNEPSLGDVFRQRRAAKQSAAKATVPTTTTTTATNSLAATTKGPQSFAEIQAEQARDTAAAVHQSSRHGGGGRGGGGGDRYPRGGGGDRYSHHSHNNHNHNNRGGNNRRQTQQQSLIQSYPIEQGCVCSLKESFGFIYCANRPEQVFFHYSEFLGDANAIPMDVEVEFRIGPSPRDASKLSAYQVKALANHKTIVWETEEYSGARVRGLVERKAARGDRRETGAAPNGEGLIRLLEEREEGTDAASGPLIRFANDDVVVVVEEDGDGEESHNNNNHSGNGNHKPLARGDLVEFRVVKESRTSNQCARDVKLLLSERQRLQQEEEARLMASAKVEHGVVTALKGEYGFLRSNSRREEIYFHYSAINLNAKGDVTKSGEEGGEDDDDGAELVLKEGQDMKFLVVEEGGRDSVASAGAQQRPRRVSARRVQLQPRGSVKFHDVVERGVTGVVTMVPQCVDSAHSLEQHGKVRLSRPVQAQRYVDGQVANDDGPAKETVEEVYLGTADSPGGKFSFRGGSSVGLWIQMGDTLLFDIVQDYSDGACRAVPTLHRVPPGQETAEKDSSEEEIVPAVRLIDLTLAGRAEGVIGALKDVYGFIAFSERPVDVHFKMHQILPDQLQNDLRRNMGIKSVDSRGQPLRLEVGCQVQFDISVHGTIQSSNKHSSGGNRNRRQQADKERENLKAQRLLFLPPNTIKQFQTLAKGVKGTVSKQEAHQVFVGTVELEAPLKTTPLEDRHPLVSKMIRQYKEQSDSADEGSVFPSLVFHDIQSSKEDEVVIKLLGIIGNGTLTHTHIPQSNEPNYPGRLCIQRKSKDTLENDKAGSNDEAENKEELEVPQLAEQIGKDTKSNRKKKPAKQKILKSIRFDKLSLSDALKKDAPPGVDDVVECDVSQCRRTGQSLIENMKIVERHVVELTMSDAEEMGIVKDVVPDRNFGFISMINEAAATPEMLFFHLKVPVQDTSKGNTGEKKPQNFRKGSAVKFNVGTEKNGKRVAVNVEILPMGALANKADKDSCRGLVLLQPSSTTLKNTPVRKATSAVPNATQGDKIGRWDAVDEDRKKIAVDEPITELGCVLLTKDPVGKFGAATSDEITNGDQTLEKAEQPTEQKRILRYKNGSLAIHGSGASSTGDSTTFPRRGDLISFDIARNGNGIRDVRLVSRNAATVIRGRLSKIPSANDGQATFVADSPDSMTCNVSMAQVVGCEFSVLKENEAVEGIIYDGQLYGVARKVDLYLETKLGVKNKERPKLNLTVKKGLGGKIMAQSMMAKGPDGSSGFSSGWTSRISRFATAEEPQEAVLSVEAPEFLPPSVKK